MSDMEVRDFRGDPFLRVHNCLLDRYGNSVGPTALATYMALCRYANNGTQSAFPSKATLAKLIGVTVPTVSSALKKLADAGLVAIEPRYNDSGGQTSNLYTLLPVEPEDTPIKKTVPPLENSDTPPGAVDFPRTRRIEQDESNKKEEYAPLRSADAPTAPTVSVTVHSKASAMFFEQFHRRRWGTKAERELFLKTEADVGSDVMIQAVTWGAENRISKVPAICTRARQIASGTDAKPRRQRKGVSDSTRITPDSVASAFLEEERRRAARGE